MSEYRKGKGGREGGREGGRGLTSRSDERWGQEAEEGLVVAVKSERRREGGGREGGKKNVSEERPSLQDYLFSSPISLLPSLPPSLPGAQQKDQAEKLQAQFDHSHAEEGVGCVPRQGRGGEEEEDEGQSEVAQDDEREGGLLLGGEEGKEGGRDGGRE